MGEEVEDTVALSAEDVEAMRRDIDEEETGAPERVAWPTTDDGHPLESEEALREGRKIDEDEDGGGAPQPDLTPSPSDD